jgi:hypothetical protein
MLVRTLPKIIGQGHALLMQSHWGIMHGTETIPVSRVRDSALDLLKWLALLCMVLDHLRYVGLSLDGLYVPGRLAFPWFCLAIAANVHRARDAIATGQWRYLGWLLLFSVISEVPYRMFIVDADTLNVLPTLALGLLVARGWQQKAVLDRGLALIAVVLAAAFSTQLMFGFFGVLLPLVMLLVFRRPWYFSVLPGLVCLAANQWQILLDSGTLVAMSGLAACLIAPLAGLVLLRHARHVSPPAMRRWAYALYPVHFLLLLLVRQIVAIPL